MKRATLVFLVVLFFLSCSSARKSSESKPDKGDPYLNFIESGVLEFGGDYAGSVEKLEKLIKEDPSSSFLHYQLAREQFYMKDFEISTANALRAIELSPKYSKPKILLGQIRFLKGDFKGAIVILKEALKDSYREETVMLLARQYIELKEYRQALKLIEDFLKKNPDSQTSVSAAAAIYSEKLKDYGKAAWYYERALELDPDNLQFLNGLAQVYLNQKNARKALQYFKRAEAVNPKDYSVKLKISLIHYELNEKEKAMNSLRELLVDNPDADKIRYFMSILYEGMKRFDDALSEYQKIPPNSKFYQDSRIRMAGIYKDRGDWKKSVAFLREGCKLNDSLLLLCEAAAAIAEDQKDYPLAIEILKGEVKKNSNDEKILIWLGMLYEKSKDRRMAIETMKAALKINPHSADALNFIGYSYADENIKLEEALEMIEQALLLKPDNSYVLDSLGWVYFKLGDLERAQIYLKKALQKSPNEAVILAHMGEVHLKIGKIDEAKKCFKKAWIEMKKNFDEYADSEKEWVMKRVKSLGVD